MDGTQKNLRKFFQIITEYIFVYSYILQRTNNRQISCLKALPFANFLFFDKLLSHLVGVEMLVIV